MGGSEYFVINNQYFDFTEVLGFISSRVCVFGVVLGLSMSNRRVILHTLIKSVFTLENSGMTEGQSTAKSVRISSNVKIAIQLLVILIFI